jgi:TolB-like protein/DNA-binding winged helix-turn-helix (wHTH) protein/cytochrome c-type biogenesis protein CcmH/NrfG
MTSSDSLLAPAPIVQRFHFDRFMLDLERGSLVLDGAETMLRPKAFAVLHHLVTHPQRLVSKDELFAVAWPDVVVTDDALVQVMGEVRRALGEDGPQLIRTVPRRGYRFEATVVAEGPNEAPADPPPHDHGATTPTAVPQPRRTLAVGAGLVALAIGAAWMLRPRPPAPSPANDTAQPVVAILPFTSQGEDGAPTHLGEGFTQDLIAALGRFSALTVMSWNAVLPWRDRPASPRDVAARLGARYQVEGSIRLAAGRVRIAAQLVDANGRVLWAGRYEDAMAGIFALEDRITTEVAGALAIRVTQAEQRRVNAKPPDSLEAYDYVLRARQLLQNPSRAGLAEARALLRRAIEADPGYPAAHAALAEADYVAVSWGWAESPATTLARAEAMATRALRLNESELRARIVLGRTQLAQDRTEQARAEMERAVASNPSDAHGLGGLGNALMWLGQPEAAIEALERAQRIDPDLSAMDGFALAMAYYLARRYDAAIQQGVANLRASPESVFNHVLLAAAYRQAGRAVEADQAVAAIRRVYPAFDPEVFGTKLRRAEDLEHLRDGLRGDGL